MLGELLGQGPTGGSGRINSIVDGNLSVLVVQPGIDVFSALLQNLLPEHDGSRRRIGIEIVLRNGATLSNRGTAIVAQVKDAGFDPKPIDHQERTLGQDAQHLANSPLQVARHGHRDVSGAWSEISEGAGEIGWRRNAYVFPRAGRPTITIAIRPEWKSLPDMVL